MKMTDADERALAAIEDAIRTSSYGAFAPGRTALIEARDHIRARLAADQQKGGGDDRLASMIEHGMSGVDWSPTPQPSIPAPAQQDGKASGGEVDDAVVRTFIAAYAQAKADRIPKVYAAGQREERDVIVALRAVRSMLLTKERHPPHADQETQG